jgi:CTP synthase (UTP-ammonia lyase)
LINKLSCSLVGRTETIKITPGSYTHQAYGKQEVMEQFQCNYGLNPQFRDRFNRGKLKITGLDLEGEVRIVELVDQPFYVATLFVPQLSSRPENPHPLIVSYLKAALAFRNTRRKSEA